MAASHQEWYETNHHHLSGGGLWLRGGEFNTLPPKEYHRRPYRVMITRLSTYSDTAESFTHRALYGILRRIPGIFPDMAYLPPPKDAKLLESHGIPWLLGTQTKLGPDGFDLIAVSNSIVQEIVNLILMLEKSGISLQGCERLDDPQQPLIIVGGASSLYTSALFRSGGPVDGVFVGEDPKTIARLLLICSDGKARGRSKREILDDLLSVEGFLVPGNSRGTVKFRNPVPDSGDYLVDAPILFDEGAAGTGNLPISAGCKNFCSFCAESFNRKPYAELKARQVLDTALEMKIGSGLEHMELFSFNFASHGDFYEIVKGLVELFPSIGLKSQRFDWFASNPELAGCLHALEKTSITCGLEGISPRLRRFLNKDLSEKRLNRSLDILLHSPIRELKVFVIATGHEGEDDYSEFARLLDFMSGLCELARRRPRIIFSITPLVRFPWTPLEFEDAPLPAVLPGILGRIDQEVSSRGFESRVAAGEGEYTMSQILVRPRHPDILKALTDAARETGFVYYREVPDEFMAAFHRNLRSSGLTEEILLKAPHAGDPPSANPWLLVDTGVSREFLKREYERCASFVSGGPELEFAEGRGGECIGCDACDGDGCDGSSPDSAMGSIPSPGPLKERIQNLKKSALTIGFRVSLGERSRGLPRKYAGAILASALMREDPALAATYRGFKGSVWGATREEAWIFGDETIDMDFLEPGLSRLKALVEDPISVACVNEICDGWLILHGLAASSNATESKGLVLSVPFRFDPSKAMMSMNLNFTLLKAGQGVSEYQFSKAALNRKKILSMKTVASPGPEMKISMTIGQKYDHREFMKECFGGKDATVLSMIRVECAFQ